MRKIDYPEPIREARPQGFDPYRAVEQNLQTGDALNRWMLARPCQKIVQLLQGKRVLDVCCGTGNLTAMLAAAGCQVVGVDRSPTMLSFARRKPLAAEFQQRDAAQLAYEHEFDAAVISLALHEMRAEERQRVWESTRRAVIPGGKWIALDFTAPERSGFWAHLIGGLIEQDERGTVNYDPEHYQNYREFMRSGGLLSWIRSQNCTIEREYSFWGGTLAVVVVTG